MPIRFRCAYCNQLMGIARRKAGSVVRCPTCGGQVVVPKPESEAAANPSGQGGGAVFENADFDDVFQQPANGPGVKDRGGARPPSAASGIRHSQLDVELAGFSDETQGCLLTTGKMILLGLIVILLLGLSFVGGLVIGKSM